MKTKRYAIVENYYKGDKCWVSYNYSFLFKLKTPTLFGFINISFISAEDCITELKKILSTKNIKPKILYIVDENCNLIE